MSYCKPEKDTQHLPPRKPINSILARDYAKLEKATEIIGKAEVTGSNPVSSF